MRSVQKLFSKHLPKHLSYFLRSTKIRWSHARFGHGTPENFVKTFSDDYPDETIAAFVIKAFFANSFAKDAILASLKDYS